MNKTAYDEFFRNYDYYWLKYTMERGMKEKADKLLVGHSLPRFGVNDRDIPGLINLSFFSQDYYYSYRIIERALECIPSIKHVVLGTCYISPFIDLSRAQDRDEMNRIISVYDRYFHDIHNMLPQKYSELKDEEQKRKADEVTGDISGKDLMSLYEARKDNYFCTERDRLSLCEDAWTETVSEEERESYVRERLGYMNRLVRHKDSYEENGVTLEKTVKLCRSRDIRLYVVVFPANIYYRRYLDPEIKDSYYRQINGMADRDHMKSIDLYESEEFNLLDDYADTDHLNDAGAAKMTELLAREIGSGN